MNDGGPAFPFGQSEGCQPTYGMSLRDYFAAAALAHVPKLLEVQGKNLGIGNIAEWAYQIADAMLRERERKDCQRCGKPADGSGVMCSDCWIETGDGGDRG